MCELVVFHQTAILEYKAEPWQQLAEHNVVSEVVVKSKVVGVSQPSLEAHAPGCLLAKYTNQVWERGDHERETQEL
jgi:hypothetical protein